MSTEHEAMTREQGAWRFGYADALLGDTHCNTHAADKAWRDAYRAGFAKGRKAGFATIPAYRVN